MESAEQETEPENGAHSGQGVVQEVQHKDRNGRQDRGDTSTDAVGNNRDLTVRIVDHGRWCFVTIGRDEMAMPPSMPPPLVIKTKQARLDEFRNDIQLLLATGQ